MSTKMTPPPESYRAYASALQHLIKEIQKMPKPQKSNEKSA